MHTPTTGEGLVVHDHLSPLAAVLAAWQVPGPHPGWHQRAQQYARQVMPNATQRQRDNLREAMPVLARALDRAAGRGASL